MRSMSAPQEAAEPEPAARAETGDRRATAARHTAKALAVAIAVLRWPSALVMVVPVLPLLAVTIVLSGLRRPTPMIVLGVLLLVGLGIQIAFVLRRRAYLRAAREPVELGAELRRLLALSAVTDEVLDLMRTVATRGGILLLRRLRATWSLIRLPDHLIGQLEHYPRARLFIPPALGVSAVLVMAQIYLAVLSWPVLVLVLALRAGGALT